MPTVRATRDSLIRHPAHSRSGEGVARASSPWGFSILDSRLKEQFVSIRGALQKEDRFRSGAGVSPASVASPLRRSAGILPVDDTKRRL
ncbi:MAG: hypothetical protein LBK99_08930, partial [Opitutaceae bacterium]|nr:hypothetical protein [Opitutaceae bacterium]